ncbi:MAG: tryptophan 7-halogenase [Cellulomonas sp.]|uniref:NAD(P)/FAD-dependent oxidoreductase n=1 Tax=Cellulomonas sp. TaxID=40001 RepID=UPI0019DDB043|nr:NAD(P)/FAD-dependent oxidoreductase [Cellulomonas sp.]MBF0688249.1 tryptophan 7-halogenase [Cellulomonas sp.]
MTNAPSTPASTTTSCDVVVVGGGPAGSVTAGLLARQGHRVTLLERETFPRYHIGESLITGMLGVLAELGVLERIEASGFPRKNGLSIVWGADRDLWNVDFAEIEGPYPYSFHVRRDEFDALLLDHARDLGVRVVERATVVAPLLEDGRVAGVRAEVDGEPQEVRAPLTVDASGQGRVLTRRLTEIEWQEDLRNIAYWTYFEDTRPLPEGQLGNILVERVHDGWFWAIPVDDGSARLSVGYVTGTADLRASGLGLQELYESRCQETKQLRLLLDGARRVADFRTTRDWSYCSERFSGPGWLAVGDAGAFIDPLFSGGVCLAVLGADAAAATVDTALRRPDLQAAALEAYDAGYAGMIASFLAYVRFFYDPTRDREDYFAQARAMADFHQRYPEARQAFVAVISGTLALSSLFAIPTPDAQATLVGES